MKFRYKVLICNIVLLSLGLGLAGYLMIQRNFRLALDAQIKNGVTNNNIVQSSLENELLREIYDSKVSDGYIAEQMKTIGQQIAGSLPEENDGFFVRYNNRFLYGEKDSDVIPDNLFYDLEVGGKRYVLREGEGKILLFVTSCSEIDGNTLWVISSTDVSEAYDLLAAQTAYFRVIVIVILCVVSIVVYAISRYLTAPLEKLAKLSDEIADGHYDRRVEIVTGDEVGQVAERFNGMAQSVEEHVEELEEMIHRRDQFVADFTHEIKTPMTSIIGYADTMRSVELTGEEKQMALNYIFSEGKRLEGLSSKLFDLIYLRQNEIPMQEIHADNIIREVKKSVLPRLNEENISLETEIADGSLIGNRELLETVFLNLIDNARKASEPGGRIVVRGENRADCYEFVVQDFGIGMPEEVVRRMCDEFYMADKSRARKAGGAGLGMSIVANILKRHEATMQVESCEGEGTKITVRCKKGAGKNEETCKKEK